MKKSRNRFAIYTVVLLVGISLLVLSANRDMQFWPVINTAGLFDKDKRP
jgi:hypothetical protein